jgi:cob(I)alamin adenosyltransferase
VLSIHFRFVSTSIFYFLFLKEFLDVSITTKTGDYGKTSLYWGQRISKDDLRLECCGTLDELSAFLGIGKFLVRVPVYKDWLEVVQKDLLTIGAQVASDPSARKKLEHRLENPDVKKLEAWIREIERRHLPKHSFRYAGQTFVSASLDVARTVCRRAERRVVALLRVKWITELQPVAYLNRVSDLLYLLAREHDEQNGSSDLLRSAP